MLTDPGSCHTGHHRPEFATAPAKLLSMALVYIGRARPHPLAHDCRACRGPRPRPCRWAAQRDGPRQARRRKPLVSPAERAPPRSPRRSGCPARRSTGIPTSLPHAVTAAERSHFNTPDSDSRGRCQASCVGDVMGSSPDSSGYANAPRPSAKASTREWEWSQVRSRGGDQFEVRAEVPRAVGSRLLH
jgi:hypothetical protein